MKKSNDMTALSLALSQGLTFDNYQSPNKPLNTNWIVITGAPGSGKTTVIESLKESGFDVVPEMSRIVIEDALSRGFSTQEIMENSELLTNSILIRNYDRVVNLLIQNLLIWDTGLLDSAAFYSVSGLEFESKISFLNSFRYKAIIYLDMLPQDVLPSDGARPQDIILRKKIDVALRTVYKEFGYFLYIIPVIEKQNRVKRVKEIIDFYKVQ